MKKLKLFKTLLILSLGVLTIGTISVVATGCGCALEPTPVIHVESVTLNEISVVLHAGKTKTLIATVLPENATDKSVTWTSSDTNVATVDANGTINAVGVGNATIIVITSDGGKTATCAVTVVEPIHVESVTLDKHNLSLEVGGNDYLTATVSPADATDQSVSWASDNETVATVDENGKVTAVAVGTANITVTTRDGGKTDTCEVTVTLPYVCLEANGDWTFGLTNTGGNNPDLQYSRDGGASWNTYSTAININQVENLCLKGNNPNGWSYGPTINTVFFITGDVSISGNIMGLLDNGATSGEEGDITAIPSDYCFYSLFSRSTVTSVSEDFLPATSLAESCYRYMFKGCSNLTTAPNLPATNLVQDCYASMFMDCSKLNSIRIDYRENYDKLYFEEWVNGVASSGTFYYRGSNSAQDFGFPPGWSKNPDFN